MRFSVQIECRTFCETWYRHSRTEHRRQWSTDGYSMQHTLELAVDQRGGISGSLLGDLDPQVNRRLQCSSLTQYK